MIGLVGGGVADTVIKSHVSAVLRKLQLSSRYELAPWAPDRRIV